MKAPKLRLPLLRTTPPQATRRRKLSRPSPHRASPPCTCLSRPPASSSTARTSCATASSSFPSLPTWPSPPALSRTSMWRRWTLTRRDTTLEVNSTRWVLTLSPWSLTNGQWLVTYFPLQVTNKFNVLGNTQRNGDKMTGYCNISPIKLILSKPLLKVGFRKLKQNVL